MFKRLRNVYRRFKGDQAGSTMTITAIMMPLLIGFSGVGLDMTHWFMQKRVLQSVVDMVAIEGVHTGTYYSGSELDGLLLAFANAQGFDASSDTLSINTPPATGDYWGRTGFVEVIVARSATLYFASAFATMMGQEFNVTISARAVAGAVIVGEQCIVSLDPNMDRALEFSGTANVVTGCGVAANSTSAEAIYIGGKATLSADPAQAVGDIAIGGAGTLVTNNPIQSFAEPVDDPFESLAMPPDTACDYTDVTVTVDGTVLLPGKYCGQLKVQADDVVFSSGTYVIYDGDFTTNAGSSMEGSEVTFLLTGSTPATIGTILMNGGTEAAFSAPTSGDYAGILFYQDRLSSYMANASKFLGGATTSFDGVLYFPSNQLEFSGGSSADPSCLLIFGAKVKFTGNSHIGNDASVCTSLNLESVSTQERVQLVE